ncbi:DUF1254 domain-containing protein [Leifsonia sp. AG29]|uniref:DUF1254 domain-containing protein n=1 Tax=Leifsonia sp. AG29 TaxID=2598860 RepID=UPI0018EED507|nr:DUF1254 domain-containing protein [Leifsonia sp. AG29]
MDEAERIAGEAYVYAYPLVLMHVSGLVSTNVAQPIGLLSPMNQFAHGREFPDPSFTVVVRPNADTLYSSMNFDLRNEPMIISVPESGGRFYLLPMLDMWTDVFTVPGTRTTGSAARTFAIVGPHWQGSLPDGMPFYVAPTPRGWIGGRTQTNGVEDYAAVHAFQDGIRAVPLSAWGTDYIPPQGSVNPDQDMSAPPDQVERMDAATFFPLFADLLAVHQPHPNDYPILDRLRRIGIVPGRPFAWADAPADLRRALEEAVPRSLARIKAAWAAAGVLQNGWYTNLTAIGTYGTDYLHRAGVAYGALGANAPDDAIYPTAFTDSDGQPLTANHRYLVRFEPGQTPPARAFWSLTMYDERQLFTENPLDRYTLGDRNPLAYGEDGSLELHIQRDAPSDDLKPNWLPTPREGTFSMNLRLYWPDTAALDGSWQPPAIKRLD